jgi:hypothetical protein
MEMLGKDETLKEHQTTINYSSKKLYSWDSKISIFSNWKGIEPDCVFMSQFGQNLISPFHPKYLMLVVSQWRVSQLKNDALFTAEENVCIYDNFQTFWSWDVCHRDAISIKFLTFSVIETATVKMVVKRLLFMFNYIVHLKFCSLKFCLDLWLEPNEFSEMKASW